MRVLVVSDTHRRDDLFLQLLGKISPVDMVIHCGDIEGSEYIYSEAVKCELHMVAGNNDFFSDLPFEDMFNIGKLKVFITHGHHYYISMGNSILKDEARMRGADIVMYGHTHKPVVEIEPGLIALNPGSLTYPRQEGRKPSYIIMDVDDAGKPDIQVKYVD